MNSSSIIQKAEVGSTIKFGRVLAVKSTDGKLHVGKPWMEKVSVEAEIVQELKDDKVSPRAVRALLFK